MPILKFQHKIKGRVLSNFWYDDRQAQALIGPLGSAKTSHAIMKGMKVINDTPPDVKGLRRSRGLVIRNTVTDLKASTIKDWNQVTPYDRVDPEQRVKGDAPITQAVRFDHEDGLTKVEAEVMFIGYDKLQDVRKLRGLQLTWAWADEAKELPKEVIDMVLGRLGRYPARSDLPDYWYGLWLTSNAPASEEWLGVLCESPPPNWGIHIQPGAVKKVHGQWVVNPKAENIENLPPNYYQNLLMGKQEDWIRANLANEFIHSGGGRPVHPDFSQATHVADYEMEPIGGVPIRRGVDFGRTPAGVFGQLLPNGQWRIYDEITTENTSVHTFSKIMARFQQENYTEWPMNTGYGDPSGSALSQTKDESCFDMLNNQGLDFIPCDTNDPEVRFGAVDELLTSLVDGEPAILINRRCKKLISGLSGSYKFRQVALAGEARFHDKPDKGPTSHVCEALQYMLVGGGGGALTTDTEFEKAFHDVEREYGGWRQPDAFYE